jgi:hypothetical protein
MYDKIQHPKTGKWLKTSSVAGNKVLKGFVKKLNQSGGNPAIVKLQRAREIGARQFRAGDVQGCLTTYSTALNEWVQDIKLILRGGSHGNSTPLLDRLLNYIETGLVNSHSAGQRGTPQPTIAQWLLDALDYLIRHLIDPARTDVAPQAQAQAQMQAQMQAQAQAQAQAQMQAQMQAQAQAQAQARAQAQAAALAAAAAAVPPGQRPAAPSAAAIAAARGGWGTPAGSFFNSGTAPGAYIAPPPSSTSGLMAPAGGFFNSATAPIAYRAPAPAPRPSGGLFPNASPHNITGTGFRGFN